MLLVLLSAKQDGQLLKHLRVLLEQAEELLVFGRGARPGRFLNLRFIVF